MIDLRMNNISLIHQKGYEMTYSSIALNKIAFENVHYDKCLSYNINISTVDSPDTHTRFF